MVVVVLLVFAAGCSNKSSGNYDKDDSYYYNNDKDKDEYLNDKEFKDAWNSFLDDKYNEYGY